MATPFDKVRWFHASACDAEYWFGGSATREEAIREGHERHYGGPFWIGRGTAAVNRLDIFKPGLVEVQTAFEDLNGENFGEDGEGGPNHWSDEALEALVGRLNIVFAEWATAHGYQRGWMLDFDEQEEIDPIILDSTKTGATSAVVIYGPMASGKTLHQNLFAWRYGCTRIADDMGFGKIVPDFAQAGDLILSSGTADSVSKRFPTAVLIPIDVARRAVGLKPVPEGGFRFSTKTGGQGL